MDCRFRCSIGYGDYRVDVGGLVVLGPQPQDRTCVLGQRCVWEEAPTTLDGVHIDPSDALMVRGAVWARLLPSHCWICCEVFACRSHQTR